jgi:DNA gyrase subunit A
LIAIQTTARNGKVVSASLVSPEDHAMLITDGGVLIRIRVSEISELSRATQGVTLINLDAGEKLIGLSRIPEADFANSELDESVPSEDPIRDPLPSDDASGEE